MSRQSAVTVSEVTILVAFRECVEVGIPEPLADTLKRPPIASLLREVISGEPFSRLGRPSKTNHR